MRPLLLLVLLLSIPSVSRAGVNEEDVFAILPQTAIGAGLSFDLFVSNQGREQVSGVQVTFFAADSGPLSVQTPNGLIDQARFFLAPGETTLIRGTNPPNQTNLQVGYAVLRFPRGASVRASLVIRFEPGGELLTNVGVGPVFPAQNFTFAAEVNLNAGINTGLAMANTDTDVGLATLAPANQTVILTLVNLDGTIRASRLIELLAGRHDSRFLSGTPTSLFPGLDLFEGVVVVSTSFPLGVLALRSEQNILSSISIDTGPMLGPFIIQAPQVSEFEINDTFAQAQNLALPTEVLGNSDFPEDFDAFVFNSPTGGILTVLVEAIADSEMDAFVSLFDANGQLITTNDQGGTLNSNDAFLRVILPAAGLYFLSVEDFFFGGGADFGYRMLAHIEPLP